MKDLYLIFNEKIYSNNNIYYCENKDIQSIVNFLTSKYNLLIVSRSSLTKKFFQLKNIYKIFNFSYINLLSFLFFIFSLKKDKKKILIISITPFNFFIFFLFKIFFECKFYIYLRSDGYKEYETILGKKYVCIYDFMFKYITKYSEVISCHKSLYKKKSYMVQPSELTYNWKKGIKKNYFGQKVNILYVGRFKIEKGIYSLLNIFSQLPNNIKLTLVGNGDLIQTNNNRIKVVGFIDKEQELINTYDSSNIVILPSFTEAHPKIIDEALSRHRPVIIFNSISYVIGNRKGIFVSKRNSKSLKNVILNIIKNYESIEKDMKKNILPTKNNFFKELQNIIK